MKYKEYHDAEILFEKIIDSHPKASLELAKCRLLIAERYDNIYDKGRYYKRVLKTKKTFHHFSKDAVQFKKYESRSYLGLSKINFSKCTTVSQLKKNLVFIENSEKKGRVTEFRTLTRKHHEAIASIHFQNGLKREQNTDYKRAIRQFKDAIEHSKRSDNESYKFDSIARILICELKLDIKDFKMDENGQIKNAKLSYQKDLYYRYSIKLLREKKYKEAEKSISQFNFDKRKIRKLKTFIEIERDNYILERLKNINLFIEKLNKNECTIRQIKKFYADLDVILSEIKNTDNKTVYKKVAKIKPTLFNRLLSHYFQKKLFNEALTIIYEYPNFWTDPLLLKNLGICCYSIAEQRKIDITNFQDVISGWLTAVFSDNVILKSLTDTSWDDQYTFTLIESKSRTTKNSSGIPENVNLKPVTKGNISIGQTQNELIRQFESFISEYNGSKKSAKIWHDVVKNKYNAEKKSIEEIINISSSKINITTADFSKKMGLNGPITKLIEQVYERDSDEKALKTGIDFLGNLKSPKISEYKEGISLLENMREGIRKSSASELRKLNTTENKRIMNQFQQLAGSAENIIHEKINDKISSNNMNKKLIPVMEECISILPKNDRLKYQYSIYIDKFCIRQYNEKKLNSFQVLKLMKEAYLMSPSNTRICSNIMILIHYNLMDLFSSPFKNRQEIFEILDWFLANKSAQFKRSSFKLKENRQQLIQQLTDEGVDINDILFGSSHFLTLDGRHLKKILEYYSKLST